MNNPDALPILYSFRRCPYAIRARMALLYAGQRVYIREVWLRHKPEELKSASPKATVPVLVLPDGEVIDESLEIMLWALQQNDPNHILPDTPQELDRISDLIRTNDEKFKHHLDAYKYAGKDETRQAHIHRAAGLDFLQYLAQRLCNGGFLFGSAISLADLAIFPFIRQFAGVDRKWFEQNAPDSVRNWLDVHIDSAQFSHVMQKLEFWQAGQAPVLFPFSDTGPDTSSAPDTGNGL